MEMAIALTVGSAGGEYMEAVVVLEWHAAVGDAVAAGQLLVTVETSKSAVEVEAPADGVLSSILAKPDAEVAVTDLLGTIGVSTDDTKVAGRSIEEVPAPEIHPPMQASPHASQPATSARGESLSAQRTGRTIASPVARAAALRRGLDLASISPSSPSGRIKLRDLEDGAMPVANYTDIPPAIPREAGPLKVYRSGAGSAVPLVMLHGFSSDGQSWSPLERMLARERPVIRVDLPNHGKSPKRPVAGFRGLAREIVDAFDALQIERAHLIGHSLGGALALALTDVRPRKIASISLIAPGGLSPEINHSFLRGIARASRPDSLEPWLKQMVCDKALIGMDFVAAVNAARQDPALRIAQIQMVADMFPDGTPGFDLKSALDRLTCPTRLIWGKADAIIPWQAALTAPGTVGLHLFDRVGHVPQLEVPDAVLAIVQSLMAEAER
jgi:pimeloyl-ACP methyl ester carboxylesterase